MKTLIFLLILTFSGFIANAQFSSAYCDSLIKENKEFIKKVEAFKDTAKSQIKTKANATYNLGSDTNAARSFIKIYIKDLNFFNRCDSIAKNFSAKLDTLSGLVGKAQSKSNFKNSTLSDEEKEAIYRNLNDVAAKNEHFAGMLSEIITDSEGLAKQLGGKIEKRQAYIEKIRRQTQ